VTSIDFVADWFALWVLPEQLQQTLLQTK